MGLLAAIGAHFSHPIKPIEAIERHEPPNDISAVGKKGADDSLEPSSHHALIFSQ